MMFIEANLIKRYRELYCLEAGTAVGTLLMAFNTPGEVVELHDAEWLHRELAVMQNMLNILQRRLGTVLGDPSTVDLSILLGGQP